ncbi:MAG: hypothetical protein JWR80_9502 [Bradyrhizobium sp.]|nr:hypothetical protein [Bradyrhizobium sp.]
MNPISTWAPQAYGVWTLVLMAAVYFSREWRATRKLSTEDRQARREGFTWQVENLQRENRGLQTDLTVLRREYDEYRRLCHEETDQLRNQVIQLERDISGMKRERATDKVYEARNDK